jgi:hypothetical protein
VQGEEKMTAVKRGIWVHALRAGLLFAVYAQILAFALSMSYYAFAAEQDHRHERSPSGAWALAAHADRYWEWPMVIAQPVLNRLFVQDSHDSNSELKYVFRDLVLLEITSTLSWTILGVSLYWGWFVMRRSAR